MYYTCIQVGLTSCDCGIPYFQIFCINQKYLSSIKQLLWNWFCNVVNFCCVIGQWHRKVGNLFQPAICGVFTNLNIFFPFLSFFGFRAYCFILRWYHTWRLGKGSLMLMTSLLCNGSFSSTVWGLEWMR